MNSNTKEILLGKPDPEPECRVDQDCPSKLSCISESCQNPCRLSNPCRGAQQCVVADTLPTRSVACVCPDGTVAGSNGECKEGNETFDSIPVPNIHYQTKQILHLSTVTIFACFSSSQTGMLRAC